MPRRRWRKPDLDEKFSLEGMEGEDVLRRLMEPVEGPLEEEPEEPVEESET